MGDFFITGFIPTRSWTTQSRRCNHAISELRVKLDERKKMPPATPTLKGRKGNENEIIEKEL